MTLPEVVLWEHLRDGRLDGLRFRRQHPIGPYVLDFYCAAARLAVEVDGAIHDYAEQISRDARRDEWLMGQGIGVLRLMAVDVLDDDRLEGALRMIAEAAAPADRGGAT
jgi:very-short-patch-repair endonuclease